MGGSKPKGNPGLKFSNWETRLKFSNWETRLKFSNYE